MLGHCCAECRMMQRVLQRFGRPSAMFGNLFAAHPQSVCSRRGRFIAPAYTYSPRIRNPFRIHSRNVRNVFVFCMLHIRITKVWFLSCKKGVFELQKYGFCFLNVALLQSVRHAFAIRKQRIRTRLPRIRRIFAALLQSVSSAFAPHKQRCCHLFASKKPKLSMCIEEFRPPKIL